MPVMKRNKTKYPGVYYINGTSIADKTPEKIYYIMYRKQGKSIEEKAGRQYQDNMTPAKASRIRILKITGNISTNRGVSWTLNSIWNEYKQNKNPIPSDKSRYNKYIRNRYGDKSPEQIEPIDIDRFKSNLLKTLSPGTTKSILALLKRIINYGTSRKLCKNIDFKIEMPKISTVKTESLSHDEIKRLLKVLNEEPNQTVANIMKMALFTGMRKSEILKLRWDDIDWENEFINIRDPKGGKDQLIPMNMSARKVLTWQKRTSEFVFASPRGKKLDISSYHNVFNQIKEKAGLPKDFRPMHGLRHAYASMLASSGKVDIYTLQKLLTHKSPQMTQRYAHLHDEAFKKASGVTDDIIANL